MKKILALVALILAASPLAFGQTTQSQSGQATASGQQSGSAEQELLKVNKEWTEAILRRDWAALDRIVADDVIFTSSTGEVSDKAREMGRARSGDLKFESARDDDVRVRVSG